MDFLSTTKAASKLAADGLVVGVYERGRLTAAAADIDQASGGWLKAQMKEGAVPSERGRVALIPSPPGVKAHRIAIVRLGPAADCKPAHYRRAIAAALAALGDLKVGHLVIGLSLEAFAGSSPYYIGRHTSEALGVARYRFDAMKSARRKPVMPLKKVTMLMRDRSALGKSKTGAQHGQAVARGQSLTRELGNLPPNVCTPGYLARTARELAKKHRGLQTKVLSEAEIKRLGMHAFLSVTGGAREPAKLIVRQYRGTSNARPIVLIGKGITFDSGGISLKPGPGMDEMKFDMCGAAAVIGTMLSVALLKLPINVTVVVPACENLPGGAATRPGDIVKSMSGQTIEILNTDAEGRLILCDALTYAKRFRPDTVIDVATLTGACVIALGHHRTAVMSKNTDLADALVEAGAAAEDLAWPMPIDDEYAETLKSNFADFANVGSREGGALIAGCFLAKFTKDMNWAHLDVAGSAWQAGPRKGASGRPQPLLTEYLLRRAGALP